MSKWVRILYPKDKRVAANTIAEIVSKDKVHYTLKHWHFTEETFKARIVDCEPFTPLKTASYKGVSAKVIRYLEDYPTGASSHAPMTGRRVLLEDQNGNQLDVLVANLD